MHIGNGVGRENPFRATIGCHGTETMDEVSKNEVVRLLRRLNIERLRALLGVGEVERAALNFEIDSPQITPQRKAEATSRRDAVMIEWGLRMTELAELESSSGALD